MMRRTVTSWLLVLLGGILVLPWDSAGAQLEEHGTEKALVDVFGLTVKGELRLDFQFKAGAPAVPFDAVFFWSEPEHQLLVAEVRSGGERAAALESLARDHGALALHTSELDTVRMIVSLPWVAQQERGTQAFRVEAWWDGAPHTVSWVNADPELFRFSTAFLQGPGDAVTFEHCCTGIRCGTLCVDCNGPRFRCDLINCDIECMDTRSSTDSDLWR